MFSDNALGTEKITKAVLPGAMSGSDKHCLVRKILNRDVLIRDNPLEINLTNARFQRLVT